MHAKEYLFILFIVCLLPNRLQGQTIYGSVRDYATGTPIADVQIINLRTDSFTLSNALGIYRIGANTGDQLQYQKQGYATATYLISASAFRTFKKDQTLRKNVYVLDEITVFSGLNDRQKDSLREREIYNQKVEREQAKTKLSKAAAGNGVGVTLEGPISSLIEKWSPKYKRLRRFQEQFRATEKRKWIEERYTLERITRLTGLKSDSLIAFRNQHPMPYDMAVYGSDLEIDSWILSCFKKWKQNPYVPVLSGDIWEERRK